MPCRIDIEPFHLSDLGFDVFGIIHAIDECFRLVVSILGWTLVRRGGVVTVAGQAAEQSVGVNDWIFHGFMLPLSYTGFLTKSITENNKQMNNFYHFYVNCQLSG